jgi:hypothetical protein
MNAGDLLVSAAADGIANTYNGNYQPWRVNMTAQPDLGGVSASAAKSDQTGEDLADDMTGLMTGALVYKANAKVVSVDADMQKSLFDAYA